MAKIEEITALLIDEISSFQKSVQELSEKTEVITNHKIKLDTSQVANLFVGFEKKLEQNYNLEEKQLKIIQNKLNKTIIFPKWMIVLFSVFFIITFFSFGLNIYQSQINEEIEKTAYEKGKKNLENHMLNFFDKNPSSMKAYKDWLNSKNE